MVTPGAPRIALAVVLLGSTAVASAAGTRPAASPVSYDVLMRAAPSERHETFSRLSPENKADIMRTHMRRWLDSHSTALSQAQKDAIADNLAALGPGFYREPTTREWRDKAIELFRAAQEVFSRDQMVEIFTLDGAYIPPRGAKPND